MMHGQRNIKTLYKLHLVGYKNTHLAMHGSMNVKYIPILTLWAFMLQFELYF